MFKVFYSDNWFSNFRLQKTLFYFLYQHPPVCLSTFSTKYVIRENIFTYVNRQEFIHRIVEVVHLKKLYNLFLYLQYLLNDNENGKL